MRHHRSSTVPIVLALATFLSVALGAPRHTAITHRFQQLTGFPDGRAGYVVDHIIPLCGGGADTVWNMQWQTVADAKAKDVTEKRDCAKIRANKKRWPNG